MLGWSLNTFKNKTVLITGASSGIGAAFAKELADSWASLVLTARSTDILNQLAKKLKTKDIKISVFSEDLSIPWSAERLHQNIVSAWVEVDILINNAWYGRWGDFWRIDRWDYASMIQLNIVSLTELCHLFLPDMLKRDSGWIINIWSTASFFPIPYGSVYSSSKAYVLTFTEALNYEYRWQGIHMMALCPWATESQFMTVATEKSQELRQNTEQWKGSMSFQTSQEVAEEWLQAYQKGKIYHISGMKNRLMYMFIKHLPRKTVLNIVGKMFGKIAGK
jgi:short-subunit dehydrogenase